MVSKRCPLCLHFSRRRGMPRCVPCSPALEPRRPALRTFRSISRTLGVLVPVVVPGEGGLRRKWGLPFCTLAARPPSRRHVGCGRRAHGAPAESPELRAGL